MASQPDDEEEVRRVNDLVSALEAVEDPADRFRRAGKLLATWSESQTRLTEIRRQVVLNLRSEKVSYRKIAEMLGVSLVRVQQIEKGASGSSKAKKQASTTGEQGNSHDVESTGGDAAAP